MIPGITNFGHSFSPVVTLRWIQPTAFEDWAVVTGCYTGPQRVVLPRHCSDAFSKLVSHRQTTPAVRQIGSASLSYGTKHPPGYTVRGHAVHRNLRGEDFERHQEIQSTSYIVEIETMHRLRGETGSIPRLSNQLRIRSASYVGSLVASPVV